jgi:hypothetical protein
MHTHIFFIHSSVVGHLNWVHSLAIVKKAAINIGIQVSLLHIDLYPFVYMPKSGMVGGHRVDLFLAF